MRRTVMALAVLGVLYGAGACGKALAADTDVKFAGTFVWSNQAGKTYPIKAAFTPNGDKKWKVVFTFNWGKGPQIWHGTAEGTLKDGEIKGDATNGNPGQRKFDFKGTFKDGQFDCTHNELTSGKPQATGTMTIKKE